MHDRIHGSRAAVNQDNQRPNSVADYYVFTRRNNASLLHSSSMGVPSAGLPHGAPHELLALGHGCRSIVFSLVIRTFLMAPSCTCTFCLGPLDRGSDTL